MLLIAILITIEDPDKGWPHPIVLYDLSVMFPAIHGATNQQPEQVGPGTCIILAAPSHWMEEGLQHCLPTLAHVGCSKTIHSRFGS